MADFYETSYVKAGRDGRRPRLCVTYRDGDGRRHERTRTATERRESAQRREAEEWRVELNRQWEEDRERRLREEEEARIPMLADYVRTYIDDKVVEGLEESTALSYRSLSRLVLDPDGGLTELRLDRVLPDRCQAWLRHLVVERGLSAVYAAQALTFLKQVMNRALEYGVLDRNPIAKVRGPKARRKRPNSLDDVSVSRLRDWIDGGCDWFRTAVALALFTGMRRGEVCGLRWRDVDLDEGLVHIRHAIGRGRDGKYLKDPKNGRSRRIRVTWELTDVLRRRRDEVLERLEGLYGTEDAWRRLRDLYVVGNIDGTWREPSGVDNHWRALRRDLGLRGFERDRCPFHDLRHTFITYMLGSGARVSSIMEIVGHSSASMTLDVYASAIPSMTEETSMAAGAMLPSGVRGDDGPTYILPDGYE